MATKLSMRQGKAELYWVEGIICSKYSVEHLSKLLVNHQKDCIGPTCVLDALHLPTEKAAAWLQVRSSGIREQGRRYRYAPGGSTHPPCQYNASACLACDHRRCWHGCGVPALAGAQGLALMTASVSKGQRYSSQAQRMHMRSRTSEGSASMGHSHACCQKHCSAPALMGAPGLTLMTH